MHCRPAESWLICIWYIHDTYQQHTWYTYICMVHNWYEKYTRCEVPSLKEALSPLFKWVLPLGCSGAPSGWKPARWCNLIFNASPVAPLIMMVLVASCTATWGDDDDDDGDVDGDGGDNDDDDCDGGDGGGDGVLHWHSWWWWWLNICFLPGTVDSWKTCMIR